MELHLKVIGFLLIPLALIHIVFPKYFNWKEEFNGISLINKQIMYVHTFFIALVVFLIGLLCLVSPRDLIETRLGNKLAFGLFIFWTIRLFIQFFGYSSKLWKGKKLETAVHIIFSLLWVYLSLVFFIIFLSNL
jgi:hypothetical protein